MYKLVHCSVDGLVAHHTNQTPLQQTQQADNTQC
jgi:hypothetical protein